MTHYTRKVKCPHCNNWSVVSYTSGMKENVYKGSPLRICDKCGKAYFDKDMEEEAISYYLGTHRFDGFGMTLIWAILGLAGGVFCLKDGEGIVAAILLVIGAFFSYGAIKILSETPDKVRNNLQCGKNLPADVEESLSRLSDINYLSFLTNNGYQVPDWFFERINVVNPKKRKRKLQVQIRRTLQLPI